MCCPRRLIVMGVSSDSGRNPIGWRTQSDRAANGNRLGGERNLTGWRTETDWVAGAFKGVHLSQVHQQSKQVPNKTVKCTNFLSVVNILAWMVHLRQVHPLKKTQRNRNNIAAGHTVMSSGYTLLYIVPPEFTLRSSCLQRRRCPCQVLRHRCRGSDRRCCRCGCLSPYWLR